MHSYVFCGLLKLWTIAAHALFSIIYQTFMAERRALHWRENDLLHERAGNFVHFLHLIHRRNISFNPLDWLIADELFDEVSAQVSQQPSSKLDRNVNWKENDSVKYGDFPDQSQSFRFFARSLAPKQTTSSLDWSGRGLSREPFIPAVRVLCKPHSYKWFLSPLM